MEVPDELVAKILQALSGCSYYYDSDGEEYNDEDVLALRAELEALRGTPPPT